MYRLSLIILLIFLKGTALYSQQPEVKAAFLKDSVSIGEPVPFAVSILSNPDIDLLLPDSSSHYSNFYFREKVWFSSTFENGQVKDSIIYYLSTFDIQAVQSFQLQFYTYDGKDSTLVESPKDSVKLLFMVNQLPDSLSDIKLMETTQFYRVEKPVNKVLIGIIVLGILNFAAFFILIFGKKISIWWKLRTVKKSYYQYKSEFERKFKQLNTEQLKTESEQILILWKSFMEKCDMQPYRKLTTKEIGSLPKGSELAGNLQNIDRAIYAENDFTIVKSAFEELHKTAALSFEAKVKEVRSGK